MALAWRDGEFVDKNSLSIGLADFGFSRGITVYGFARAYGAVPFRLEDHLERLEHGANMLGIDRRWQRAEVANAVQRICAANGFAHSGIKFFLMAGECGNPGTGFAGSTDFTPHLLVMEEEVKPHHPEAPRGLERYRLGTALKTVPFARQMPTVKTTNYAPGFAAAREWSKHGFNDILYTYPGGVAETTMGNFFAVIDGVLCTPNEEIFFGVTRKVLLELAAELGLPAAERPIAAADLARATEAFVTGSYTEMLPVRKIDDVAMQTTMDGPVFKKLRQAFSDYITESCRAPEAQRRASA